MMRPANQQFFYGLESLRGVAAMMVVLFHVYWINPLTPLQIFRNSFVMVDLFFVLSGFVIYHNYAWKIKEWADLWPFLLLRFGRLFPLHFFFLMLLVGLELAKYFVQLKTGFIAHQGSAFSRNDLLSFMANLLLIQPFFDHTNETFNSPSWSIGVEFYTYAVFALSLLFFKPRKVFVFVSALIASAAVMAIIFGGNKGLTSAPGFSFLRCIAGFYVGILSYEIYQKNKDAISRWSVAIEWLSVAALAGFLSFKMTPNHNYAVLPLFALLVIITAATPVGGTGLFTRLLNSFVLRWLGRISYSIYMSHLIVLTFMDRIFEFVRGKLAPGVANASLAEWLGLGFVFLAVALVLLLSHFTHEWIEVFYQNKFRRFVKRWFPTPASASAQD